MTIYAKARATPEQKQPRQPTPDTLRREPSPQEVWQRQRDWERYGPAYDNERRI
jgi:hypothetical protein